MSHFAGSLNLCQILQRFSDMVKHFVTPVLVQHLTSPEEHSKLHSVAFLQKFPGVIELDNQVVLVCFWPEPNSFQRCRVMLAFFMTLANFSLLLIQPLTIIHYPTNRRVARWRHFHKIQAGLAGSADCLVRFYDSHLIVRFVD